MKTFEEIVLDYLKWIAQSTIPILDYLKSNSLYCILFVILCFLYNIIMHPEGAINTFMIFLVDLIFAYWPSTPDEWTLGGMLIAFSQQFPGIGWGSVFEIFQVVFGMLTLFLFVKLWRIMPFS